MSSLMSKPALIYNLLPRSFRTHTMKSLNAYSIRLRLFVATVLSFAVTAWSATQLAQAQDLSALSLSLKTSEIAYPDIVEGAEKTIRWHNNEATKTPYSIVYLHGFSATRQELSPLIEKLADSLKANVFFTRLRGHGRSEDAMLDGSVEKWQKDTLDAYQIGQQIGHNVIIVGTSTGATLATWLNSQTIAQPAVASILISPNFKVKSRSAKMVQWRLGLWLAKQLNGEYYSFTPHNDFHARYWTERYPLAAVVPMLDLVDLVDELDKSTIEVPQLIIYSPNDQVVDVEKIIQVAPQFSRASVSLVPFTVSRDPSQHVLVGNASSPEQVDDMLALITEFIDQTIK